MKYSRADKNRTVLADKVPIDTPYVVGFWTGDVCNFKCKYCECSLGGGMYTKNKDIITAMMQWDVFVKAADSLRMFGMPIKKILFSSIGEPLLNKKLPDMIQYVKGIGVARSEKGELPKNASVRKAYAAFCM